jgi:hypothetical protein
VFDLAAISEPIVSAKQVRWTGMRETSDPSESCPLKGSTCMPGAVLAATWCRRRG